MENAAPAPPAVKDIFNTILEQSQSLFVTSPLRERQSARPLSVSGGVSRRMGRLWIEACLNTLQTIPTLFPFTCEAGQAHYNAPPRGVNAHHASAMLTPENGEQAADNVGSPENCEQVAAVPRRNVNRFHGVVKEQHRNSMTLLYGNVSALLLICEIAHDAKRPQPAFTAARTCAIRPDRVAKVYRSRTGTNLSPEPRISYEMPSLQSYCRRRPAQSQQRLLCGLFS